MVQYKKTTETTRYFFFRDLDHQSNLFEGKTFHAAGIVEQVFNEKEESNGNKDLSVVFLDPFDGIVTKAWRSYNEVELFEVSKEEYDRINSVYSYL